MSRSALMVEGQQSGACGRDGRPGRPRALTVAALATVLLAPTGLQVLPVPTGSVGVGILADNLVMWLMAGLVVALVLAWEGRSLASIGLQRPPGRLVLVGLAAGVVITLAGMAATGVVLALGFVQQPPEALGVLGGLSAAHRVLLVVTAAVTEEILYRGYPIERLAELTGRPWCAAAVPGLVFVAVHLPFWGATALPLQVTATAGFIGLYLWKRNLPAVMIAHAVVNAILLLLLPALA
jgi:membrane protease YdiL (CAAX protease family)